MEYRQKYSGAVRRLAAGIMFSVMGGCFLPGVDAAAPDKVMVNRYVFEGQGIGQDQELKKLLSMSIGSQVSLVELEQQADKITKYLRSCGYLVAFAYVPPQDFSKGAVRIVIEPGRYDKIIVENSTPIHETAIRRELGMVALGAIVEKKPLERAVYLIGDMANADVKTALKAGEKPGTTTLTVSVKPKGKSVWGYAGVDNGGYRYTGRYQWSVLANYGNMAKEGDLLSASLLYTGKGQTGGSLSYTSPFLNQGSRWGISYARSQYTLGGIFEPMGATGTADTFSLSYQKNLLRSPEANAYASVRFEHKRLNDDLDVFNQNGRKSTRSWVAGIHGDWKDGWQGGGFNTYSLHYTFGKLSLDDEVSRILDDSAFGGHDTEGRFGKYNLSLTRLQKVRDRLDLFISYTQQWSDKNLDSSEKMTLGGPYGVRAYPIGEASGDQGWLAAMEMRWNLPKKQTAKDAWQLIAFVDSGGVRINKNPGIYDGDNHRDLSGWGVGVNWSNENNWAGRLHYSWKLGSEEAVSDKDKNGRVWLQLYKFF